jgi:hypothetical protein
MAWLFGRHRDHRGHAQRLAKSADKSGLAAPATPASEQRSRSFNDLRMIGIAGVLPVKTAASNMLVRLFL